jgi:hypothetical protein
MGEIHNRAICAVKLERQASTAERQVSIWERQASIEDMSG